MKLTKLALGVALGAVFLISGNQAGLAQSKGTPPDGQPPRNEQSTQKNDQGHRGPGQGPGGEKSPGTDRPKPDRQNSQKQAPNSGQSRPDDRDVQKPGQGPDRQKPSQGPTGQKPSSDFNKWDKGWPEQPPNGPKGQRPGPSQASPGPNKINPGIDQRQARELAHLGKMTGYKPLPDKVRKTMVQGHPLPPQIQVEPVPEPMRKRLPQHPGYEWRIAGRDLILVSAGALVIYEIIQNVFD